MFQILLYFTCLHKLEASEDHDTMNNEGSMTFYAPPYTDAESKNSAIDTSGKELLFSLMVYNKLFLEYLSVLKSIFVLK